MQGLSKKTYSVAFILIILVLISVTTYLVRMQKDKTSGVKPLNSEVVTDETLFTGNLQELMNFGKDQKCTWVVEDGSSGEVYTDGTRSYFEVNNIPVGAPSNNDGTGNENDAALGSMYTITDGEYFYSWSTISNEGVKIKIEDQVASNNQNTDTELAKELDKNQNSGSNPSQNKYDYKCNSWDVDESRFALPSDVVFQDLSSLMAPKYNSDQINKVCDMLEGEEKAACLNDFEIAQ